MRSKPRLQRDLFSAQGLLMAELKEGTIYRFLLDHGHLLFPDRVFDSFYSPKMGRPAVSPSILMKCLILKQYERLSDEQTVQRATWDGRWAAVNDTQIGRQPFAKSTLQLFRAKCILDKEVRSFLERTVEFAEAKGLKFSREIRVALDTTPIVGAAAVRDTYDLLADAIRVGLRWLKRLNPQARKTWLSSGRCAERLGGRKARYLGKSLKGAVRIDWDNADERDLLLEALLDDLTSLLALLRRERKRIGPDKKKGRKLDELLAVFEEVAGQDVEPKKGGGVRIRKGTAPDRKPSVHDPQMRHGRKSSAGKFTGYKAAVAVDVETGLVTEAFAMKANQPDGDSAVDLVEGSQRTTGRKVREAFGDTAFGTAPVRKALEQRQVRVTAKAPPASHRKEFSKDHFQVDPDGQWVRCPAGHVVRRRARRTQQQQPQKRPQSIHFEFPLRLCRGCRDRPRCTDAVKRGRPRRGSAATSPTGAKESCLPTSLPPSTGGGVGNPARQALRWP